MLKRIIGLTPDAYVQEETFVCPKCKSDKASEEEINFYKLSDSSNGPAVVLFSNIELSHWYKVDYM